MKKKIKMVSTIGCLALALAMLAFGVYAAVTSAQVGITSSVSYTAAQYVKADIFGEQGATGVQTAIARSPQLKNINMTTTSADLPAPFSFTASPVHDGQSEEIVYKVRMVIKNKSESTDDNTKLYVSFSTFPTLSAANQGKGHDISVVGAKTTVGELSTYASGTALPAIGSTAVLTDTSEVELAMGEAYEIDIILSINIANSLSESALNIGLNLTKESTGGTAPLNGAADPSKWAVSNGVITSYIGNEQDVVVPAVMMDGTPITTIAENAFKDKTINSLTINNNITQIADDAFDGATISEVHTDSLESWLGIQFGGMRASPIYSSRNLFVGDSTQSLSVANIPENSIVYPMAFCGLVSLTQVNIPANAYICEGALAGTPALGAINMDSNNPLYTCDGTKLIDKATNTLIATTYMLSSIPNTVTKIGIGAFACSQLPSVTIPDSVTEIASAAFFFSAITSINLNNVETIGQSAFEACSNLQSVTFSNGLTTIGDWAFSECTSLTGVTFPSTLTSLGEGAFYDCESLTGTITLPVGLTNIGERAFWYCSSLTGAVIQSAITSIPEYMFSECYSLLTVTLPSTLTSIDNWAFSNCYHLVEVINLSNIQLTKGDSDNGIVAQYAIDVYSEAPQNSKLIYQTDYVFYNNDGDYLLIQYTGSETEITLPGQINSHNYSINQYAFNNSFNSLFINNNLTKVTFSSAVISIGHCAFGYLTSLTTIILNNGLTEIESSAFYECSVLQNFTIPSTVTTIGNYAFDGCESLTTITIPASVANIGSEAFRNCTSLGYVTFEEGSQEIELGYRIFGVCSSLTRIYMNRYVKDSYNLIIDLDLYFVFTPAAGGETALKRVWQTEKGTYQYHGTI